MSALAPGLRRNLQCSAAAVQTSPVARQCVHSSGLPLNQWLHILFLIAAFTCTVTHLEPALGKVSPGLARLAEQCPKQHMSFASVAVQQLQASCSTLAGSQQPALLEHLVSAPAATEASCAAQGAYAQSSAASAHNHGTAACSSRAACDSELPACMALQCIATALPKSNTTTECYTRSLAAQPGIQASHPSPDHICTATMSYHTDQGDTSAGHESEAQLFPVLHNVPACHCHALCCTAARQPAASRSSRAVDHAEAAPASAAPARHPACCSVHQKDFYPRDQPLLGPGFRKCCSHAWALVRIKAIAMNLLCQGGCRWQGLRSAPNQWPLLVRVSCLCVLCCLMLPKAAI